MTQRSRPSARRARAPRLFAGSMAHAAIGAALAAMCAWSPVDAQQTLRPGKIVYVDVPADVSAALDAQAAPRRPGVSASTQAQSPMRIRMTGGGLLRPAKPPQVVSQYDDSALPEDRRFDQVTFVTAHNAFATSQGGWIYAQQEYTLAQQLQLGVRGLMLDIYASQDAAMGELCVDVEVPKFKPERVCSSSKVCKDVQKKKKVCRKVCGGWDIFGGCAWFADAVCEWVADGTEKVCEDVVSDQCVDVQVPDGTTKVKECLPDPETCVYSGENRVRLCHEESGTTTCKLTPTKLAPGQSPKTLASALKEVKAFLDGNPKAIITIFFESTSIDSSMVAREFTESGIAPYVYRKSANQPWPTLKAMRESGKRLVVFSNYGRAGLPDNWQHVVETKYDLNTARACEIRTETTGNVTKFTEVPLLTINHFYPIALDQAWVPSRIQPFNADLLKSRIGQCTTDVKRTANFIALDFVNRATAVWPIVSSLNSSR
ncbi:MAG: hypothetical protein P3B98_06590 [Gemmatimonadota bacterium]|nr:hypothetical protein [Gemmatimonadota bacterium]